MATDHELLEHYTARGDDSAFAEVVNRHLPHVFAAALRQTRDHSLAEDVAQVVEGAQPVRMDRERLAVGRLRLGEAPRLFVRERALEGLLAGAQGLRRHSTPPR